MDQLANTLSQNFTILSYMMQSISVLMGVAFTFGGLFELKKLAETRGAMSQQHSIATPLMMIICGAMLLILPQFLGAMALALFGYRNPMAYTGGPGGYDAMIPPILMFVRLIGVGSFIRGIVLLSRSAGHQAQPGTLGKALVQMLAGLLCVHIQGTVQLLEELMGLTN